MNYLHPDVLDNGPAYLRANAVRVLVLPAFDAGMTYAQAVASALIVAPVTADHFSLLDDADAGRLVFMGVLAQATLDCDAGLPLHVVFTDGIQRVLLAAVEPSQRQILAGQSYRLPSITYLSPQPQ